MLSRLTFCGRSHTRHRPDDDDGLGGFVAPAPLAEGFAVLAVAACPERLALLGAWLANDVGLVTGGLVAAEVVADVAGRGL